MYWYLASCILYICKSMVINIFPLSLSLSLSLFSQNTRHIWLMTERYTIKKSKMSAVYHGDIDGNLAHTIAHSTKCICIKFHAFIQICTSGCLKGCTITSDTYMYDTGRVVTVCSQHRKGNECLLSLVCFARVTLLSNMEASLAKELVINSYLNLIFIHYTYYVI